MSKLKLSSNLFLEVNELNRLVQFLKKDGYELAIKSLVKTFGIVQTAENNYYKVTNGYLYNQVVVQPGIAFDSQLQAIVMKNASTITIENNGNKCWLVLQYASTNYENGTVSVAFDGSLVGVGTNFLSVLRGQPNFPVKVKFNSTLNKEDYEVVSVTSDTNAVLAGSFSVESNVQYSVVGAFTPGFQPAEGNKLIYEMDYYNIQLLYQEDEPTLTSDQFILASAEFVNGSLVVTDLRAGYMFNVESYNTGYNVTQDEIVSLVQIQRIQSNLLEVTFEHAYNITAFELSSSASATTFLIKEGYCNFLGTGDIPDELFKGWYLVNRANMKKVVISGNTNKVLSIPQFNDEVVEGDVTSFIVVPPYTTLEYMITYSGENISALPYYHSVTQGSGTNKILIPVPYGEITLGFRYRMINGNDSTAWGKFSIAEFTNENGEKQMIGDSQVTMTINEPVVELRNYS